MAADPIRLAPADETSPIRELLLCRVRQFRAIVREARRRHVLRMMAIALLCLIIAVFFFFVFLDGFRFVSRHLAELADVLYGILFSMFFTALGIMLLFSNGIIIYASLFRSKETTFLYGLPVRCDDIFLYKLLETVVFSSWAFLFLSIPMVTAFGVVYGTPWYFYPGSMVLMLPYLLLCASAGAIAAVLIAYWLPRNKKQAMVLLGSATVTVLAIVLVRNWGLLEPDSMFTEAWLAQVIERAGIESSTVAPHIWVARALLLMAQGKRVTSAFYSLVVLSWGFFVTLVAVVVGGRLIAPAYDRDTGRGRRRTARRGVLARVVHVVFFFLPVPEREFLLKDLRTFKRDAAQWSQFLIFFGLLGVYFVNICRLTDFEGFGEFWRNLVSFLNLGATALTLATFTSRFVFPQVSLEGKRFWVLGLAPVERRRILRAKFIFSFLGSLAVSLTLILVSAIQLGVRGEVLLLHAGTMVLICGGLSGSAVGFGAIFPDFKEDNPSKIVSGFGGTLNLIVSVLFVMLVVLVEAVPCHFYYSQGTLSLPQFRLLLGTGALIAVISSIVVAWIPYRIGRARFDAQEM